MTNVFISIDMEGIASIVHLQQVRRETGDFSASRELMTDEANAADGSVRVGRPSDA
jgi:D-aminopeptidase